MIELLHISKKFKSKKNEVIALNNINIQFQMGKLYAIMGNSGSGKSTLLNIVGLLDNPTSGSIYINHENCLNLKKSQIKQLRISGYGYVFQDYFLSDNLTVYENIMLPLFVNKNVSEKEKHQRVYDLILMTKLRDRMNHFPTELSGGERQRVAIARSLVNNPNIILADEPTGNLDSENENMIFELFRKLANIGKCIIVISHSDNIKKFADEIYIMDNGRLNKRYEN